MQTGISTATLFLREETENALKTIKSLNASCAEIFFSTFYEYRPEFSKALKPETDLLSVRAVHALSTNFEHQFFSPSRRVRGDAFYWLDQILRSAQLLNCKKYTFHGFYRMNEYANNDNFDELGGYVNAVSEFCRSYGVELCLENVSWSLYNRPEIFKKLKERCSNLSAVFDLKQARRSGYPYQTYIADMSGHIAHAHLSDVNENGKICLPGKGVYNFEEIFKRLKDSGFDGEAFIEVYPESYKEICELKESLEYLNEIIYKIK